MWNFHPIFLISDAARSIHNGFRNTFGEYNKVVMCWYHMIAALTKRVESSIEDKTEQNAFIADDNRLQVAKTYDIFDVAAQLFIKKWRPVNRYPKIYLNTSK